MTRETVRVGGPSLLERDAELALIGELMAAAAAGDGRFLVVEGRAGMGKSALLAEVRARASRASFTVCSAGGSELEDGFAFGVLRQLFEPAVNSLSTDQRASLFEGAASLARPVLGFEDQAGPGGQFAAFHGLYWLAANLTARAPLLIAVDDAHWTDENSIRWLAYLLNRLEGLPALVALTTRPVRSGARAEMLATVTAPPRTEVLRLAPLGEESVATLVRDALRAEPDPAFYTACHRATAGNPLAVREIIREFRTSGVAPTAAAAADIAERAPEAVAHRVLVDLRRLGDVVERVATALAVLGDGTDLRLVSKLARVDAEAASEAADALTGADLLTGDRPPRFMHPLLRAAVYDRAPLAARSRLHLRASAILVGDGADAETVAAHLLRSEPSDRPQSIEWLRAAAPRALRRGAPEAAITYLRRALAEECEQGIRTKVLEELGEAELAAGDPGAASHLNEALVGLTEPLSRLAVLSDLSIAVLVEGDQSRCLDLLRQALAELGDQGQEVTGRLECVVTGMTALDSQYASSLDGNFAGLRMLSRGESSAAPLARMTLALGLSWRGAPREEASSFIDNGIDWEAFLAREPSHSFGVTWSIMALVGLDELRRTVTWAGKVVAKGAAEGNPYTVINGSVFKAFAEYRSGLLAEAEADATSALEHSKQHGSFWTPYIISFLADTLMERGHAEAAFRLIESPELQPGLDGSVREALVLEPRGRLRCIRGDWDEGIADLRRAAELCELMQFRNPIFAPWRSSLARALATSSPDEARHLAEEDLAQARRVGIPRGIGVALRTLATLRRDRDAVELLKQAVEVLEPSPAALELARALIDLGAALRRLGNRVAAREPLRQASEIAASCGAIALAERARTEALAAGARPRRPRLRGLDALTPSELRVARLAAEGRTNREVAQALFITTKTVADHLGSSYSKLSITSRDQLADALGSAAD